VEWTHGNSARIARAATKGCHEKRFDRVRLKVREDTIQLGITLDANIQVIDEILDDARPPGGFKQIRRWPQRRGIAREAATMLMGKRKVHIANCYDVWHSLFRYFQLPLVLERSRY
jgi:hypothetical protein